ncbi:neutral/alkaline non-lysosomal ceramidase N-terminal domain-containing protein [Adhaeribacter radiodurans]|uniref:Neutral/alkaline non-lysosomal ceramidase N-terminal domain-containing protein n=1 Tax=Adhaeribacter radiodurans TaxID=2745197 RepID=A0A7L7LAD2_9BACT|nr:neutral/alkaline non-lysosomal ceramidase N-terminal domain-containing protein [Adhaeribacter radiodurans]QMU29697.1 neutral/alkaline non-lysosomal ceramidase N-terminal domain-containing protein [Adhaeribacter radiodurans]
MKRALLLLFLVFLLPYQVVVALELSVNPGNNWKAGVARIIITPKQPLWIAGYANRKHPSESTRLELFAKALALEDASGKRAVMVTTDLLGLPKDVSDNIREQLQVKFNISKAQILLNSSHTHSGPVLGTALLDIYPLNEAEKQKIAQYTQTLENQIVELVRKSLKDLEPARLYAQNGVTRFQVNRRNNNEDSLALLTNLEGPNDYAVPVMKIVNAKGKLKAIAFGYACHPTVLNDYKWSGDYPGYAQLELEKEHKGATALFFQSAGADQNPLPRRSEARAQQYGRELAAAVDRVLEENMTELSPALKTTYTEINLPLDNPPSEAKLLEVAADTSAAHNQRWARRMLTEKKQGKQFRTSYPYPLQAWQLGDQLLLGLGGELVVDYAIRLKKMFGLKTFVLGYSNDVMAYIPSARILKEGGYEGATSQMVYGLPAPWGPGIEEIIINGIKEVTKQMGVEPSEANNLKLR